MSVQRRFPLLGGLAILLCWLGALRGPFQFDDLNVIVHYGPVHSLAAWWDALPGIRPLLKLSYALNRIVSPDPFGFHLVNLVIHAFNTVLFWRWLQGGILPDRYSAGFAAALWALHPVQTEAVTYIAGRSVSLATTCLLLLLLAARRESRWRDSGVFLLTLAGLAVRETGWIAPALLWLALRLDSVQPAQALRRAMPSLLAVALVIPIFLLEPHYRRLIDVGLAARDWHDHSLTVLAAWRYFLTGPLLTLTPNIDPDIAVPARWDAGSLLMCAGIMTLAAFSGRVFLRNGNRFAGGVLWFFLCLLPVNGILPRLDVANDRHLYAALMGPAWMLAYGLGGQVAGRVALSGLAIVLAIALLIRNEDYRSATALWTRTAQQSPGKSRVWNNLGVSCREEGHAACALMAFREAWRLDPGNTRAGVNLYFQEQAKLRGNDGKSPPFHR